VKIKRLSLGNCTEASGTVIVVDVIRAFTVAPYACAAGAREVLLAGREEEALTLRDRFPGAWAMGEVDGLKPEGVDVDRFDFAMRVDRQDDLLVMKPV
jgi:phosphosulfolactate phosphohydrolase-like enzyme